MWDSPPTSSEDWKKVEKDLTLSLGVQGYLTPSKVSCLLLGNISLEWWNLLLVFSQHQVGTPPHPTVLPPLNPFFNGSSHSGWPLRTTATYSPRWTPDHQVLPEWRTESALQGFLLWESLQQHPTSAVPYRGVKSTWLGICQVPSGHLWASSSFPWFFFLIYKMGVMSLCCRFVISTKCIIACEAFQHSLGCDGALERCLSTRLQCQEMISGLLEIQIKRWPHFRRFWGSREAWG